MGTVQGVAESQTGLSGMDETKWGMDVGKPLMALRSGT